jgi:hypothetical protein
MEAVGDQDQVADRLVPGKRLVAVVPLEELLQDEEDGEARRESEEDYPSHRRHEAAILGSIPCRPMSVVYLTRQQLDLLIEFTEGHQFSVSLEEGESGESYVTGNLMDAAGNVIDTRTWSWTGGTLRPEELETGSE